MLGAAVVENYQILATTDGDLVPFLEDMALEAEFRANTGELRRGWNMWRSLIGNPTCGRAQDDEDEGAFTLSALNQQCGYWSPSNYPPAEPGALRVAPLKAAIGVAGAPPMFGPPEGGQRVHDASRSLAGAVGRVQFRFRDLWKGHVPF